MITVTDGPDERHPLLIRLTLDHDGEIESRVFASAPQAAAQLLSWLEDRADSAQRS